MRSPFLLENPTIVVVRLSRRPCVAWPTCQPEQRFEHKANVQCNPCRRKRSQEERVVCILLART